MTDNTKCINCGAPVDTVEVNCAFCSTAYPIPIAPKDEYAEDDKELDELEHDELDEDDELDSDEAKRKSAQEYGKALDGVKDNKTKMDQAFADAQAFVNRSSTRDKSIPLTGPEAEIQCEKERAERKKFMDDTMAFIAAAKAQAEASRKMVAEGRKQRQAIEKKVKKSMDEIGDIDADFDGES